MKEALRTFWENRSERDHTAIGAAAILIALAVAYTYVWLPVTRERDRLLVRVPELRAEAQAMERDAAELNRLRSIARPTARDLKAAIEEAAIANGITLARGEIAQQGSERVRVSTPSVRASQWFDWIARLQSSHGVRLESARMIALGEGDRVNVESIFAQAR